MYRERDGTAAVIFWEEGKSVVPAEAAPDADRQDECGMDVCGVKSCGKNR